MIRLVDIGNSAPLNEYRTHAYLSAMVNDLRFKANHLTERLRGRTLWMMNSTANGGGVAEMMPKMVTILRQLGVKTEWIVFSPDNQAFFQLTKRIHNLIHDFGKPGFTSDEKALYEKISHTAADALQQRIPDHDVLIVHDPQPLGAGAELKRRTGIKSIWRCHIGLDKQTPGTTSAWEFLKDPIVEYDHTVFSALAYLPPFLNNKYSIITPAIDPLSHKNRDLSSPELFGILIKAGIIQNGHPPLLYPRWKRKAMWLNPDGKFMNTPMESGVELLYRPTITQISRWDRLKGWLPLLEGFVFLKRIYRNNGHHKSPERMRILASQLILVGPEPSAVQDDPEGKGVLDDICNYYKELPAEDQKDISILTLPMSSRTQNHLMVNALQRCSTLVVQNSIQEGFGLTATEAMWKKIPVLGTSACGLRQQIRDGKDGCLTADPMNEAEIAENLRKILSKPKLLEKWGRSAQQRVYKNFLVFKQIENWLTCVTRVVG